MKYVFLTLLGLVSFSLTGQKKVGDANLKDLNGKKASLSTVINESEVTIISFWATWCGPCKKELDALSNVYPEWKKEYPVNFLAISVDDSRTQNKVKAMVASKKWPYKILLDGNQEMMRQLNFYAIPQTYVVNKKGEILHAYTGYIPGVEKKLKEVIIAETSNNSGD